MANRGCCTERVKELCDNLTDYIAIYTDGSKEGDKVAFAIVTPFSTFSKRLLDKESIFKSEMSAILTALKYIKGKKNDKSFILTLSQHYKHYQVDPRILLLPLHLVFYHQFMQNLRKLYFVGSQVMLESWGMSRQILQQRLL